MAHFPKPRLFRLERLRTRTRLLTRSSVSSPRTSTSLSSSTSSPTTDRSLDSLRANASSSCSHVRMRTRLRGDSAGTTGESLANVEPRKPSGHHQNPDSKSRSDVAIETLSGSSNATGRSSQRSKFQTGYREKFVEKSRETVSRIDCNDGAEEDRPMVINVPSDALETRIVTLADNDHPSEHGEKLDYPYCSLPPHFYEYALQNSQRRQRTILVVETWDGRSVMTFQVHR